MKKIKLSVLAVSIFILMGMITACSKELNEDEELTASGYGMTGAEFKSANSEYEDLAYVFHKSLKNKKFRVLLKDAVEEKFDGDYNVLLKDLYERDIEGTKTKDFLKTKSRQNDKKVSILDDAYRLNQLQLAIPILIEKWDAEKEIPVVAFKPIDYDKNTKFISAFDSKGNRIQLDVENEPNFPVIILGINERTNENGELIVDVERAESDKIAASLPVSVVTKSTMSVNETPPSNLKTDVSWAYTHILQWDDNSDNESYFEIFETHNGINWSNIGSVPTNTESYTVEIPRLPALVAMPIQYKVRAICGIDYTSYSNTKTEFVSYRDIRHREYLTYLKYEDIALYERWIDGAPETRIIVTSRNQNEQVICDKTIAPTNRLHIKKQWWYHVTEIEHWQPEYHGRCLYFKLMEYDGTGSSTTISIPIKDDEGNTMATVSYTVKTGDEDIGGETVFWHDKLDQVYDLGLVQFRLQNFDY